jgi:uncharacterized protein (TIGR02246 family)
VSDEIKALWQRMAEGWANADGEQFASVFAEDVEFVNVRGEEQHGRPAVAANHGALFRTRYRDTKLTAEVHTIRFLGDDVAVVHVASTVHSGESVTGTHAQAVVQRRDGEWLITAFHNMIPAT